VDQGEDIGCVTIRCELQGLNGLLACSSPREPWQPQELLWFAAEVTKLRAG
jgi:hypothetical protein